MGVSGSYPAQEIITVGTLVDPVQDGVLRPQRRLASGPDIRLVEPYLHHVACAHPPALRHAVYQGFVQIQNQRLLMFPVCGFDVQIGRLPARDQRARRCGCLWVFCQRPGRRGRGLELRRYIGNGRVGIGFGSWARRLGLAVF